MTDRYYPKGLVPTYKYESTYNLMNLMDTHPRSDYPPGYSGHEHGKTAKFGYGTPAADPTPDPRECFTYFDTVHVVGLEHRSVCILIVI